MIEWAFHLIRNGETQEVLHKLYYPELPAKTIIKKDLEYIAHHWSELSFDLWEEELGLHYYTLLFQKKAMVKGAKLAEMLGDSEAAAFYLKQAQGIEQQLLKFIDQNENFIRYTIYVSPGLNYKNSGLDIAVLLAEIQTYEASEPLNSKKELTETVRKITASFKSLYQINSKKQELGIALGRYPEDKYNGYTTDHEGNPWFLSTLALAEYYCRIRDELKSIHFEELSMNQFKRVMKHSK